MDASLSRRSLLRASLLAGLSAEALEGLQRAHEAAPSGDGKLQISTRKQPPKSKRWQRKLFRRTTAPSLKKPA